MDYGLWTKNRKGICCWSVVRGPWSVVVFWLLVLGPWSAVRSPAFAQPNSQRFFEQDIAPDMKATWVAVDAFPEREAEAKTAFQQAAWHAREILDRIDPLNPFSELTTLLAKKQAGTFSASPELTQILYTTQEVAKAIGEPLAKKIKVSLEENEVKIKSLDVIINIEPLLRGYLADVMMTDLLNAGFPNSFLDVEGVFVTRGQDFNGPWKIQVVDQTTANAHRAFFYQAHNTTAATVRFDQRSLPLPVSDLKSVTIFTKESACKSQGLATALYAMGLDRAEKFLKGSEIDRAVLIDYQGKFHQYPEEKK